jgi:GT2 family glycosyltransferase
MKLSVVIICWNDLKVILECISSIRVETSAIDYEIIVTDNASSDGSIAAIRERFPNVRIVENLENGGFAKGNNAGIRVAKGEYILILNPDTIVRDRALEKLVAYAERYPEAGAFGCRVLNPDGSVQLSTHPLPTLWTWSMKAFALRWPARFCNGFCTDEYRGWDGRSERPIGFQGGCCLLVRGELLRNLGGFDERFFHQFEDADLCRRIWDSGRPVLFFPGAEITHIGGQNRGTYSIKVELEVERSKYRYFHKYYGAAGAHWIRFLSILELGLRCTVLKWLYYFRPNQTLENKLRRHEALLQWHWGIDPKQLIQAGLTFGIIHTHVLPPANTV